MKKILLTIFLLSFNLFAFQPGDVILEPKIGIGLNFVMDSDLFNVEGYTNYGLEAYHKLTPRIDLGTGLMYNKVSTTKKTESGEELDGYLERIPAYICMKFHVGKDWYVNPYLKLMLGYQFVLNTDFERLGNGRYYGAAIGLNILRLTVETFVTVESNEAYVSLQSDDYRGALGYGFSLGYRI